MAIVPLLAQSAFDPEFVQTLVSAYEDAWRKIEQSGSTFASPRYRRAAQEIVAKRIIDMAQRGEREPTQLADDAVAYLARSYAWPQVDLLSASDDAARPEPVLFLES